MRGWRDKQRDSPHAHGHAQRDHDSYSDGSIGNATIADAAAKLDGELSGPAPAARKVCVTDQGA